MNTNIYPHYGIIAFGKARGLQVFYDLGFERRQTEKLVEQLQLDLDEMPLRKGDKLYSKILVQCWGELYTFFIKYQFDLDAYGRKGYRAAGIGLKGKKLKNWEDAIRLSGILRALSVYEFSVFDFYLARLHELATLPVAGEQMVLDQLPYVFPAIDNLSEIELATFIYISLFESSHLPWLEKLYLTNSRSILVNLDYPSYELVSEPDFDKYIQSFAFSLFEQQSAKLELIQAFEKPEGRPDRQVLS